jgi:hypothetical protein
MKTKLLFVLVTFCLVLSALMVVPSEVVASCSGDLCGCSSACEDCPSDPDPASCFRICRPWILRCSICCCCEEPYCPPYCGGGSLPGE